MGLLAGVLTSGFAVAIVITNVRGFWDNAKKYIGEGYSGGRRSDTDQATVVGVTVRDPSKDTSGPSLNILIRLMSMVSVVFAGLIVAWAPRITARLGLQPKPGLASSPAICRASRQRGKQIADLEAGTTPARFVAIPAILPTPARFLLQSDRRRRP